MASPNPSLTGKLTLEPNVPQRIALKFPTGKIVESRYGDEKQVFYSLADGRSLYASLGLANAITNLGLGNREHFLICKRWNGEKMQKPRYDVWLTPEGEKERAARELPPPIAAEEPPSELEEQLAASLAAIQAKRNGSNLLTKRPPVSVQSPAIHQASNPGPQGQPVLEGWSAFLLQQTNQLIDVYAQACIHAESQGVPPAVVRTVMLSAFINVSKRGGGPNA